VWYHTQPHPYGTTLAAASVDGGCSKINPPSQEKIYYHEDIMLDFILMPKHDLDPYNDKM